jgi:hypothetical protein
LHIGEEIRISEEAIKQFEEDNRFFFDKRSWEKVIKLDIPIMHKGVNLICKKYKEVKAILRRGVKLKFIHMIKLKNIIQCSLVDSIDQGRVNRFYFYCLKRMNMFNRFHKIENWLINHEWNDKIIKRVRHKHYSNYNFFKQKKSKFKNPMAVNISSNNSFRMVLKDNQTHIDKAIKYLKWNRNKFKLNIGKITSLDVMNLELDNMSFGIQKEEENFVIWKHVIKWTRYAEVNYLNEGIVFESKCKKKKRRRIKTIIKCVKEFGIDRKIKENKIYELFTKENRKFIIRKMVRRRSSGYVKVTAEEETDAFNLFEYSKLGGKKPPDKITHVSLVTHHMSVKPLKMFKGKRKKRRRKLLFSDQRGSNLLKHKNEKRNSWKV